MGRVVGCGEHDACICTKCAYRVAHQRRRALSVEEVNIRSMFCGDLCRKLGKLRGKMTRVMGNDDAGPAVESGGGAMSFDVGHQPTRGAGDVEEVHRIGSHTGVLRPAVRRAATHLGLRDIAPYRPPAQTAGAKLERDEKSVVQLIPQAGSGQLFNAREVERIAARGEEGFDVFSCIGKKLPFADGCG